MQFLKRHLTAVVAGFVIVGGASYVAAAEVSSPSQDEVTLAQGQGSGEPEEAAQQGRPHQGLPRAIRGELTVHARDGEGFAEVRFDRGTLDRIDGMTLVITEDDG